jgi:hypothetical protein
MSNVLRDRLVAAAFPGAHVVTRTDFDRQYHLEPLYIGQAPRTSLWDSPWFHAISIVAFLVLMMAAVLFAGGTFQLGAR